MSDGVLHIRAERRERTEHKDKGGYRTEFRYGSFTRDIPLPGGSQDADVSASYRDGVLEVRSSDLDHPAPRMRLLLHRPQQ